MQIVQIDPFVRSKRCIVERKGFVEFHRKILEGIISLAVTPREFIIKFNSVQQEGITPLHSIKASTITTIPTTICVILRRCSLPDIEFNYGRVRKNFIDKYQKQLRHSPALYYLVARLLQEGHSLRIPPESTATPPTIHRRQQAPRTIARMQRTHKLVSCS